MRVLLHVEAKADICGSLCVATGMRRIGGLAREAAYNEVKGRCRMQIHKKSKYNQKIKLMNLKGNYEILPRGQNIIKK